MQRSKTWNRPTNACFVKYNLNTRSRNVHFYGQRITQHFHQTSDMNIKSERWHYWVYSLNSNSSVSLRCEGKQFLSPCPTSKATSLKHSFHPVSFYPGSRIAQWLERQTHDWKVAGSNPCRSGGRTFFSGVNFLCWLILVSTSPPCYCSST